MVAWVADVDNRVVVEHPCLIEAVAQIVTP